jgi:inosine/xanthosine triphosphatase
MKINVGSQNATKVTAVMDTVKLYPEIFISPEVVGVDVALEVFGHPKSLEAIVEGAVLRAKAALRDSSYSFGIESGLFAVPHSLSGFMEIQACAIFDGKTVHLGFSSAFEWPKNVTELILKGEVDGSAALRILGITNHKKIGAMDGGIIGVLTKGRLTREKQIESSIISAMVQIEQKDLYS